MIKANYHTHMRLCNHAIGDIKDYVKKAIELGLEEIGISDHNPVPRYFMSKEDYLDNWIQRNMQLEEFYDIYLKQLDEAILLYGNKINILRGLECEYVPKQDDYYKEFLKHLDYLNLGLHFFIDSNGMVVNSYHGINYLNVIEYAKAACKAMDTRMYKIFVHPDLFMFNYKNVDGKRIFDENCIIASKLIIESAIKNNVYLEINANGLYNSIKFGNSKEWLYPDINFWQIVKSYSNIKVIIGSDAHDPKDIYGEHVKQVEKFALDLGINVSNFITLE